MAEYRDSFSGSTVSEAYELGRQDERVAIGSDSLVSVCRAAAEWSIKTFPDQTIEGKLAHLAKEVEEIQKDPDDLEEYGDAALLLFDSARFKGFSPVSVVQAMATKLERNKKRTWGKDEDGVHHHISEPTDQAEADSDGA